MLRVHAPSHVSCLMSHVCMCISRETRSVSEAFDRVMIKPTVRTTTYSCTFTWILCIICFLLTYFVDIFWASVCMGG